jgi:hypothetical protein
LLGASTIFQPKARSKAWLVGLKSRAKGLWRQSLDASELQLIYDTCSALIIGKTNDNQFF